MELFFKSNTTFFYFRIFSKNGTFFDAANEMIRSMQRVAGKPRGLRHCQALRVAAKVLCPSGKESAVTLTVTRSWTLHLGLLVTERFSCFREGCQIEAASQTSSQIVLLMRKNKGGQRDICFLLSSFFFNEKSWDGWKHYYPNWSRSSCNAFLYFPLCILVLVVSRD